MFAVPDKDRVNLSLNKKYDKFYKLPKMVECFIDRANSEIPDSYVVLPWTINRTVSVFERGYDDPVCVISYEVIEDDIVGWLDTLQEICT